jgi:hypothetical protein
MMKLVFLALTATALISTTVDARSPIHLTDIEKNEEPFNLISKKGTCLRAVDPWFPRKTVRLVATRNCSKHQAHVAGSELSFHRRYVDEHHDTFQLAHKMNHGPDKCLFEASFFGGLRFDDCETAKHPLYFRAMKTVQSANKKAKSGVVLQVVELSRRQRCLRVSNHRARLDRCKDTKGELFEIIET